MQDAPAAITATILGCGSSGGVPRLGNRWGACDPTNPKNRRRRAALLVTGTTPGAEGPTQILIDTGPDIREQLLDAAVERLDAVFYTHDHADHTHGIDDLRVLALNNRARVDVWFSRAMDTKMMAAFGYCFATPPGSDYPPILDAHHVEAGETVTIAGPGGDIAVTAFAQRHGEIESLGYRIGSLAYSCDLNGLPDASVAALADLDTWIVDALRPKPHVSHFSLADSLEWIARIRPRRAILTDMTVDMDYQTILETTPDTVEPAYDGMVIEVKP